MPAVERKLKGNKLLWGKLMFYCIMATNTIIINNECDICNIPRASSRRPWVIKSIRERNALIVVVCKN